MRAGGLLLWLLWCVPVAGEQVYKAAATHQQGSFIVEVDALLDAGEATVRSLLTDYAQLGRLNPAVEHSEIVEAREPGDVRVRVVAQTCLWFYCRRFERVQDIVEAHDGSITAVVIPELSDFSHGFQRFNLWQETAGTRLLMRAELTPDFWVPPLIGPWLLERELRSQALDTLRNLERVAAQTSLPHNTSPGGGVLAQGSH